jgi:catechol 2,3-dioxygenase-like lactoylglutathione lyase family enzyme
LERLASAKERGTPPGILSIGAATNRASQANQAPGRRTDISSEDYFATIGLRSMRLNHVTLAVADVEASADFYLRFGLTQIVASYPDYARLIAREGESTLSLQRNEMTSRPTPISIHFEVENVDQTVAALEEAGFHFETAPTDEPYLWREATLVDPDGYRIFIYSAGENRLNPPWRLH